MNLEKVMKIPGTTAEEQRQLASKLASEVTEDGWIIEVGSFHGRQTVAMVESKSDSVQLTCIDTFPFEQSLTHVNHRFWKDYCLGDWQNNTSHLKNTGSVMCISPPDIPNISFTKEVDLLVFDIDWIMTSNLFWDRCIKIGGKFLIQTYEESIQDEPERVLNQVLEFKKTTDCYTMERVPNSTILTKVK